MTDYFRLMNQSGGFLWVQSIATCIINSKNADELSIICVNHVLRFVYVRERKRHAVSDIRDDAQHGSL